MTFVKDLKFGKTYEKLTVTQFLATSSLNEESFVYPKGKFKPYDIMDTSTNQKYECKSDRYTYITKNVCIEFQFGDKKSGISSTESDFYFYYVVNPTTSRNYERVYKIPTADIRKMIEDKLYHKIQKGGDGWKAKFYLFTENLFSSYIISINE